MSVLLTDPDERIPPPTKRATVQLQIAAAKSLREAVRVVVEAWRRMRR